MLFMMRAEDSKPLDLEEGQEVWMQKEGTNEDFLVRVLSVQGREALVEDVYSASA
jgi:hypothetical protein